MARLAGMVHGVVVQMTTEALRSSKPSLPNGAVARADRELHPDGVALVVGIFDLGFGQRGALDHRPHHGLGAAIELAGRGDLHQLAGDLGFGVKAHGQVGIVPVADDAEALELLALGVDPVLREGAALGAEFVDLDVVLVLALGAVLLLDLPLDGQAVAVPARHIGRVVAEHLHGAADEVLERSC